MGFRIRSFIASDGERFSQLYDEAGGFPLFYPTAYVARVIRHSTSHETQLVYLEAIKRCCEWQTFRKADLPQRFQKGNFLSAAEVDDLARHLQARRRGKPGDTISRTKYNTYLAYVADYLRWLADEVISETNVPEVQEAISTQTGKIKAKISHKRGSKSARAQRILVTRLTEESREQLLDLFINPLQGLHRPSNRGSRLRNVLMLRILYETGIRAGEILSLRLGNLEESGGTGTALIHVKRNHHDAIDTRIRQPVAKTLERSLPISPEVENQLSDYIQQHRAELPYVGFSDKDFLFVNHRKGKNQGKPLTASAFNSAMSNLRRSFPKLVSIHPHLLRHDWNYRFSQECDEQQVSIEDERTMREMLMGWRGGSNMSELYNRRHIQEKANEFARRVASDTKRKVPN